MLNKSRNYIISLVLLAIVYLLVKVSSSIHMLLAQINQGGFFLFMTFSLILLVLIITICIITKRCPQINRIFAAAINLFRIIRENIDEAILKKQIRKQSENVEKNFVYKAENHREKDIEAIYCPVIGKAYVGKTTLVRYLNDNNFYAAAPTTNKVKFIELNPLDTDSKRSNEELSSYENSNILILILTEDLTSYEYSLVTHSVNSGKQVIIALNKIDLLTEKAKQEIIKSIADRIESIKHKVVGPINLSLAPRPIVRIRVDKNGNEKEEEYIPKPNYGTIYKDLRRMLL